MDDVFADALRRLVGRTGQTSEVEASPIPGPGPAEAPLDSHTAGGGHNGIPLLNWLIATKAIAQPSAAAALNHGRPYNRRHRHDTASSMPADRHTDPVFPPSER